MNTFLITAALTLATIQSGRAESKAKVEVSRLRAEIHQTINQISKEAMLMPYERFNSPEGQQKMLRLIKLAEAEDLIERVEEFYDEVTN